MVEIMKDNDGELVGVEVRNSFYLKIYGLTEEEYKDACKNIKEVFGGKGYKYIAWANDLLNKNREAQELEVLAAENQALKEKLAKKEGSSVPKTLGMK